MPSSALETFKAAALAAGRATTDADFLHEAVHQLAALVGSQRCSILLIEDRRLRTGAAIGLSDVYLDAIDGVEIGPDVGTCGTAGHTGEPCITADIETDPRWAAFRDLARSEGLRACWSVPLNAPDGRTIGTFATYADRAYAPSIQQVELAQAYAAIVALGLDGISRLTVENALLAQQVRTDALTGVASRAAWEETLQREELHRSRSGAKIAVAIFDVDGLKQVNDQFGHLAGDGLLRACARILASNSRSTDFVARIGGDEFGVLLRYSDEESARGWCERVHAALREAERSGPSLSVSAGFACAPPLESVAAACAQADAQMYAARAARRAVASR
jgi:diguanylate cyclase (GGDEF)-like protein